MRLLQHRIAGPEPCPYLDGLSSTTETMLMTGVTPAELDSMLERGWRRFGPVYFRPVCSTCDECVSVRVPVGTFSPSVNLRRVRRRAAHLRLEVGEPMVDDERLTLYRKWHASREVERGWKPDRIGVESYAMQFCFPHAAAREFSYWDEDELI
ncbi:MAG: arginyltransferase, partial [Deltaproteobacteria bacterium]